MIQCQNCGQFNSQTGNFCRFCGTKYMAVQFSTFGNNSNGLNFNGHNFEYAPPRPYSWKTDEFQIPPSTKPAKKKINQVQPLADFRTRQDLKIQPFQHPSSPAVSAGYHCPRCQSQLYPRVVKQISTAGWIVFAVLLATIFPLFWIGLLIKDEVRVCPVCNLKYN